jgi:uncharacterized protein (DUF2147 family)
VASAGLNTIPTHFALPALTRKQPMSSQIMFSQTTASQIRRSASLLLVGCSSLCLTAVVLVSFARPAGAAGPEEPRMQQANPADALVGVWKPSDMDVDIQVVGSGGQYQGVVVKAANPAMMNTAMLRGITFDPSSNTWKGEVFAPKRGMFVPMTIRMTAANGFEMVAGIGMMTKTVEWVRLQ